MKKLFVISALLLAGIFYCEKNPADNSSDNPFEGTWTIMLAGDYTGGGEIQIGKDGQFSDTWTLKIGSATYNIDFTGSVTESGEINADIFNSGAKVGSSSGTLSGETGNGTWQMSQPQQATGTWTAIKGSLNPNAGIWMISLSGDITENELIDIGADGTFAGTWDLTIGSTSYTVNVTGSVSASGEINGELFNNGVKIGSSTGTVSGEAGSGTWQITSPSQMSGTWVAIKGSVNPFAGAWNVALDGDLNGGGDINIGDDGTFSDTWTLTVGSVPYPIDFSGIVTVLGSLSGEIFNSGAKIGTASGTLSGNSGSGTWQISSPIQASGTWTATKGSTNKTELEGAWSGYEQGGVDNYSFTFMGDKMEGSSTSGEWYKGTFSLDTTANPKTLDYVITECMYTPYIGEKSLGICRVVGDTLTFAANEPGVAIRPTAFVATGGTRVFVAGKQ